MINTIRNKFERFIKPLNKIEERQRLGMKCVQDTRPNERHPKRNGDAVLVDEHKRIVGIFDGKSFANGDTIASRICKQYIIKNLSRMRDELGVEEALGVMESILIEASGVIAQSKEFGEGRELWKSLGADMGARHDKSEKPGTTATIFKLHTDNEGRTGGLVAHVGNCRLYKIGEGGKLTQITEDHDLLSSFYPREEDRARVSRKISNTRQLNKLDKTEKLFYKVSNQLSMVLGEGRVKPAMYRLEVTKGDRFLLLSDGIHGNLTTDEMEKIIGEAKTMEEIKEKLMEGALLHSREKKDGEIHSHPDDMSLVVVEIENEKAKNTEEAEKERVEEILEELHKALE